MTDHQTHAPTVVSAPLLGGDKDVGAFIANGCESIAFVEGELDEALSEMQLDSSLPIEMQRAVASRAMLTLSLAAAVGSERDYEIAVRGVLAPLASLATAYDPAELGACLTQCLRYGAQQIEREMAGLPEFREFNGRITQLVKQADAATGLWSTH